MKNAASIVLAAATIVAALLIAQNDARAQNPAVCPGLRGEERTQCLRDEVRRADADSAYWGAYTESLERDMNRACDAARALDSAARALSRNPNARVRAAGMTWTTARSAADAALRQRGECDRLRRELRRRR